LFSDLLGKSQFDYDSGSPEKLIPIAQAREQGVVVCGFGELISLAAEMSLCEQYSDG
jgi:hypothetical protein